MLRRIDRRTVLGVMLAVLLFAGALMAADPGAPGEITFVGKNAFATANGTFHLWRVVDRSVDLNDPGASWAEVEIDLASVDTGIERRDDHLRDPDFFEVETWPLARVRAHSLTSADVDEEACIWSALAACSDLASNQAGCEAHAGCDWRDDDTLTTNVNEASCTIAADLDGVETETEAGVPPEAGVQTACLSAAGPPPPTEATCAAAAVCQVRWDFGTFAGCPEDCGVTDASEDRTLTREVSCRKQAHCHGQPEHDCAGVFAAAGGDEVAEPRLDGSEARAADNAEGQAEARPHPRAFGGNGELLAGE